MVGFSPMMQHTMSQHHLPSYGNQHFFNQQGNQQFLEQQNRIGFLEQKIHRLEADNQILHQQNSQIRGQYTQSEWKASQKCPYALFFSAGPYCQ